MPRMTDAQKTEIVTLFTDHLHSCNQISQKFQFSRTAIKKFLNNAGYDTSKAKARNVTMSCKNCNKIFKKPTSIVKRHKPTFCSMKCYYEYIKDGEYKPWRHGQRIARAIMEPTITLIYGPNQQFVCHHKDGDDSNNHPNNILAFPNQSSHLAYHRNHKIVSILLDGANT
jgi:hypothetical protein